MDLLPRLSTCLALVTISVYGASAPDTESDSATGPGADPAYNVCNDEIDDVTVTSPVSRRPIPVPTMIAGKYE
jgi:hypothetical protein